MQKEELNLKLKNAYEREAVNGDEHLASFLVHYVEELVQELNTNKWSFDRYEYSGDKCFRQSEQWLTTTNKPGEGTVLHFTRFSVQIESLT